ncbi:MAG: hypothetical protein VXW76_05645 [Actinomycetota bacterium]|nr:hypothetical protein [Actinomycetota bacterium]
MSNKFKISTARLAEIIREEYALIQEEIKSAEVSEKKIKNPGPYMGGEREKAGVDDDGDGVPNNADSDPHDGDKGAKSKKDKKKSQKESIDSIRDLIRKELESL